MTYYAVQYNGMQGAKIENQSMFCDHIIIRILLETCTTAQEALEMYQQLPKAGGAGSLIIADPGGDAFLINFAGPTFAYRQIGHEYSEPYLCSTNHYLLDTMWEKESFRGVHSILRYKAMNAWFEKQVAPIDLAGLQAFQALTIPDGPCCHYYTDWLGTIRSMIYDVTAVQAHVCFGSPVHNDWHIYDFCTNTSRIDRITSHYANETADPNIWKKLPPGCTNIEM